MRRRRLSSRGKPQCVHVHGLWLSDPQALSRRHNPIDVVKEQARSSPCLKDVTRASLVPAALHSLGAKLQRPWNRLLG